MQRLCLLDEFNAVLILLIVTSILVANKSLELSGEEIGVWAPTELTVHAANARSKPVAG